MTEQEKEQTQPVVVNTDTPSQAPKEGTQPVEVTPEAPETQLPEWLLKFASGLEQSTDEIQDADEKDILASFSDDVEEVEAFIPPELPVENEWQELSDFQDQDLLDMEAVEEAQETTAELEAFYASETEQETDLIGEVAETSLAEDPQLDLAESFKQELRDLLKQDQLEDAIALMRENKTDPLFAEAAKKILRSQLTLSSEAGDLWDIYDELNSSSD